MELQYEEYGFYRIDKDYLEYLHSVDDQVFFKDEDEYDRKVNICFVHYANFYVEILFNFLLFILS